MSAGAVMSALQQVLPTGTAVAAASAVVEKGLAPLGTQWPAIIINCPQTHEEVKTIGGAGGWYERHQVHVLYVDRWESSARTLEQAMADARTALEAMKANVRGNRTLKIPQTSGGTAQCVYAGQRMDTHVDGPVHDDQLGFPVISAELTIEVLDFLQTNTSL